jgi:hypothetical protein
VTGAVLDRPSSLTDRSDRSTERPVLGGRVTLEERLNSVLHEARTNGSTECPLCHARMTRTHDSAECGGCGSRLS